MIPRTAAVLALTALALIVPASASASSAHQSYERLWHADSRFYAPGQPSPLVSFNTSTPDAQADTVFKSGQPRLVEVSRGATRGLQRDSASAREVIEWEWARVFGSVDQSASYPRPVTNALLRYRNGHGSPLALMRSRLAHWGENPRLIVEPPATENCPAGYTLAPDEHLCYPDA